MDNSGRLYPQIYYGTPYFGASAGYTNDLGALLTGPGPFRSDAFGGPRESPAATLPAVLRMASPIGDSHGIGDWWDSVGPSQSSNLAPASDRMFGSHNSGITQPDPSSPDRSRALDQWASSSPRRDAFPSTLDASTVPPDGSFAGSDPFNPDQAPAGGLLGLIQEYMRNNAY
jgi:hypothetical protein